jgi:hypothetical protein
MKPISEEAFLRQVIQLARLMEWRVAHFRPGRTAKGWRTPVQGDGKGFPDLVLLKGPQIIVAELKADKGRLSTDQRAWLEAWKAAGARGFVWHPSDWLSIVAVLEGKL